MPERRVKILPDGPDWEWYQELADGALPPTKAELWRPYVPCPGADDVMAGQYDDPLLDAPYDF